MSLARPFRVAFLFVASVTALYTPHFSREIYDQTPSKRDFQAQNAKDAQALNAKFATLTADSSCTNEGDVACIGKNFAMCTQGKYVQMSCGPSLQCYALPLINKAGTTVTCDTKQDALFRLGATGSEDASTASSSATSTSTVSSATSTSQPTTISVTRTSASTTRVTPTRSSSSAQSTQVTTTSSSVVTTSTHETTSSRTSSSAHETTSSRTHTSSASGPSSTLSVLNGVQTGDATWYNTGLTACGDNNTDDQAIVAVSHILFDEFPGYTGANPNNNPICGKKVKATYQGRSVTATITDRCAACKERDLDFTPSLYKQLDPNGSLDSGRLHGMTWEWV